MRVPRRRPRRASRRRTGRSPSCCGAPGGRWCSRSTRRKACRRRAPSPSSTSWASASRYAISSAHGENVADAARDRARLRSRGRHGGGDDGARADRRSRRRPRADQGGDRRPAQRRQVDARQHAARRGARDRLRPAGHDARLDLPRFRARRPPLHADRHRRRPAPRQGVRGGREVLGDQDAAGDRGRQRRGAAARRAARRSPSRTRISPATSSRPAARWSSASTSGTACAADRRERRQARVRAQARASCRSPTTTTSRRRRARGVGELHGARSTPPTPRRWRKPADAEAHPDAAAGRRAPAAAARRHGRAPSCATRTRAARIRR